MTSTPPGSSGSPQETQSDRVPARPRPSVSSTDDPSPSATWEERQQFDAASMDRATLARLFPEFKIVDRIHHGGFGAVYSAFHRKLNKPVAFKVFSRPPGVEGRTTTGFLKDLELLDQLPFDGLVRTVVSGERNGILFLAQEWVDGIDLATLQRLRPEIPVGVACALVHKAAKVLQNLHEKGIKHLEIKPSELMVERTAGDPSVRVLNVGLSRLSEMKTQGFSLDLTGKFRGTVDYLAPEQIERPREVDERADLYALGAVLYRLLTGRTPHQGEQPAETAYQTILRLTREPAEPLTRWRPGLPGPLADLVQRMIAPSPLDRPLNMAVVMAQLAPYGDAEGLRTWLAQAPFPEPPRLPERRSGPPRPVTQGALAGAAPPRRVFWLAWVLGLAGLLALAWWGFAG
jgi:serine/threonine-protein kinase